jgi:hypothetical protein
MSNEFSNSVYFDCTFHLRSVLIDKRDFTFSLPSTLAHNILLVSVLQLMYPLDSIGKRFEAQ